MILFFDVSGDRVPPMRNQESPNTIVQRGQLRGTEVIAVNGRLPTRDWMGTG